MKEKTNKPLKWSMIGMLVLCWLLPLMLIALSMLYFISSMLSEHIEKTVVSSTDKAVEICEIKLEEIMTASKKASYMMTLKDSYKEYKISGNQDELYSQVTLFLNQQYKYDFNMLCSMVFFLDEPEQIYYTYNTYRDNNNGNSGYKRITFFKNNVLDKVLEIGKTLDTETTLHLENGHLYMIRNLMDSSFKPYAMIVIELNPESIFTSLNSVWGGVCYQIYVDDQSMFDNEIDGDFAIKDFNASYQMENSIYAEIDKTGYSYQAVEWGKQQLLFLVKINEASLIDDLYMARYIFALVIIFLIPLVVLIFWFFHKKVTKPVNEMVKAAEQIIGGDYGYQIEAKGDSKEFAYLHRTFNAMSLELKYQFERIFKEELELKDAKIMALQSQINPHFLNNTLEIINWEARMCGAESVSGMIEALGTMLSATMNRKSRRFVTLVEELSYVDAYLYIISRRFGNRFQIYRDIDEKLLELEVPILIIQPIVENAVEYGVEKNKEGMVEIKIFSEEDKIVIEVKNNGTLSEENKEKIEFLLNSRNDAVNERHVSLGIRNVNRRIKIIYGRECGLTIENDGEKYTVSRIVVKKKHENNKSQ